MTEQQARQLFEADYMKARSLAPFVSYQIFKKHLGEYIDTSVFYCFKGRCIAKGLDY